MSTMRPTEDQMLRVQIAQRQGIDGVVPENMFDRKYNPGIQYSNILQYAGEHLGDLVHRLAYTDLIDYGINAVLSKLNKRYDFNRFWQQLESNYSYHIDQGIFTGSYDDFVDQVKYAGERYADAYTRIPVYTEPQRIAKHIAIDLGNLRFNSVEKGIQKLKQMFSGSAKQKIAAYWQPAQHIVTSAELPRGKKLNKPFRTPGQAKKFAVYVRAPNGNIKLVRFGDPGLRIRQSDPKRRASFRARHKCDTKKDKTTPGYWSCQWSWPKLGVARLPV